MRMTDLGLNWKGYIAANFSADTIIDLCSRWAVYSPCHKRTSARSDIVSCDTELQFELDQTNKYLCATDCTQCMQQKITNLVHCYCAA
jgi:hypothetical protein